MKVDALIQLIRKGLVARVNFPEFTEGFPMDEAIEHGSELGMTTDKDLAQKYGGKYVDQEALGPVAQRLGQLSHKQEVDGSNPSGPTKRKKARDMSNIYRVYTKTGRRIKEYYRPGDATLYLKAHLPGSLEYNVISHLESDGLARRVKITAEDWLDGKRPAKE